MRALTLTLLLVGALFASLAGCGGKSGPSAAEKAATTLRQETLPGPNGTQMSPTSVVCKKGTDGSDCTVIYPDGQVQNCAVSVSGNSSSSSCFTDPAATAKQRAKLK